MAFNIGLSGLRAATKDLNVTGNNIANAGTAGFKQSRAEFADVYAASMLGTGKNPQGSGVLLGDVAQLFNQGNINYTQNALDLAINGNGFFQVSNNGALSYTRAGYFGTDRDGFIVDNFGYNLQGYTVDANDNLQTGVIGNLRIQTASQEPRATSTMAQTFNLNSNSVSPTTTPFNPADPTTYNSSTSTNIYDTQGNAHVLTQYFVKDAPPALNSWTMHVLIDGRNPSAPESVLVTPGPPPVYDNGPGTTPFTANLTFTEAGQLLSSTSTDFTVNPDGTILMNNWTPAAPDNSTPPVWSENGANQSPEFLTIDLRRSTQFASSFAVSSVSQNGYTTGELAGLEVDDTGLIFARYTNGQSKVQGQVILANFANVQGLTPIGKTQWVQSFESGEPVRNPPGSGTLGVLQAGALEDSNVELSDQLVNLIVAQRNYQANAKTIETESAITQTIINLR
ncbi:MULTISPECIES: flagellar hook protein FlgE [Pseudomonas]|uniref:flagellar hook protein FlgE n=1 Tax=Pseudomonas TaxID=286 RepID=UPI001C809893|nr:MULTISPECIES: flagellar hook protein FlgE [Pseudomonas]MDG9927170.1 flagellar hook protein FlgE [Pseudomonas sp. GD04042]MDH0482821.1 flagellar hook protein FlgE [Pseudomonas sp. GD04015]MDH0602585.1 flagellar hook protein FlgE [Pseudomonas sp. GD03869]MDH0893142.1 flagellar hook protein FlgE [Pseudomonas sp. GD03875]MDH1063037.1 flagellar hook protein FlgE [Pseudomonas sp. GD03985]